MKDSAQSIAKIILEGFDKHFLVFRTNSQLAKNKFEKSEYSGIRELLSERISFYDLRMKETSSNLEVKYGNEIKENLFWPEVKKAYIMLLTEHKQPELAESFFNSIATQVLDRIYFQNHDYLFVRPSISTEYLDSKPSSYRVYYPRSLGLKMMIKTITRDVGLEGSWENIARDIKLIIKKTLVILQGIKPSKDFQIHVMRSLFFRNKGAYMIGRIVSDGDPTGFAIPILKNRKGELFLDTIVFHQDSLGVLFSFSRAYFMADMEVPSAYVNFLKTIMPSKPTSELYTMLGLQKQGKTLFYRDLLHHLNNSRDKFVLAEGIKETLIPGLKIIGANTDLAAAEVELTNFENREYVFKSIFAEIDNFDFIFVDCPPALGLLTINSLVASDTTLIPLQSEFFALEGLSALMQTIKLIQQNYNNDLQIEGILLTMLDKRNSLSSLVEKDVRHHFGDQVYKTTIPRNVKISEAPSHGKPALIYDTQAAGSLAYIELAKEVILNQNKNHE